MFKWFKNKRSKEKQIHWNSLCQGPLPPWIVNKWIKGFKNKDRELERERILIIIDNEIGILERYTIVINEDSKDFVQTEAKISILEKIKLIIKRLDND
jgi:methionine aminopeptidase